MTDLAGRAACTVRLSIKCRSVKRWYDTYCYLLTGPAFLIAWFFLPLNTFSLEP